MESLANKPMPTVKTTAKEDTKSKAADAVKEAARLRVIESSSTKITPLFKSHAGYTAQVKDSMFKIMEATNKEVEKNTLDKAETGKMLAIALAQVYTDGDESAVAKNMTANTLKSKFLRLAHPVDDKAKKQLAKALEKGVDFNEALLVARGKKTAAEANKKGSKGGAREKTSNAIEDEETFGNALASIISRALDGGESHPKFKGGLSLDEIENAFSEVLAGFRAKLDGTEGDETPADD